MQIVFFQKNSAFLITIINFATLDYIITTKVKSPSNHLKLIII